MADKIQLRGNCPQCGAQQAVVNGGMSKHGYVVKNRGAGGWFSGVCNGEGKMPMQQSRLYTEAMCEQILKECEELDQRATDLAAGKIRPQLVKDGYKRILGERGVWKQVANMVPFADAPDYAQKEAIRMAVYSAEQRAKVGRQFVKDMLTLLDKVFGSPLIKVGAQDKPARIESGERRKLNGRIYICQYVDRGRVYYKTEEGGFKSWMGTQAWRKAEVAA